MQLSKPYHFLKLSLLTGAVFAVCLLRAESKEHKIVVNGSKASIDGIPITHTIPYKKAFAIVISYEATLRALGPAKRSDYGHNDLVMVWDSLGFTMLRDGEHPKDGQIWNFAVEVAKEEHPRPTDPKTAFKGSFSMNGIPINSTTLLKDIAPKLEEQGFRKTPDTPQLGYQLVKEHYELVIAANMEGFVRLFIFRSNEIMEAPKKYR